MSDLAAVARLDAIAQAELCARGDCSAAELFDACIARIEALNPVLRAVVTVADASSVSGDLAASRKASARGKEAARPLAGVPFLVKDSMPWPGLRWSMGARAFANNRSAQQTPYAKRLVDAGLVCAGKSAMSELGLLFSTETLLEGVTHNPWDLSLSAGGSSGGSAAAVAAGLVPLAHASDGGGSIRVPASACGVFGYKPSRGRTVPSSLVGSDFADMTSDHCISRSVRDSALFLALTEEREGQAPVGFVRDPIARPLRIATWTRSMTGEAPAPHVQRSHDETVALLVDLGHVVEHVAPPVVDGATLGDAFFVVSGAAAAGVVEMLDQTRTVPVQVDELEPFTWSLIDAFLARAPGALARARVVFAAAVQAYGAATRGYDVVLTPTVTTEPWRIGHLSPIFGREEILRRTSSAVGYTPIHNIAGCPAMSVPLHARGEGPPSSAHFAAAVGADALLLGLAYQLEAARPWKDRWPPYSIPALESASER